MLQCLSKQTLVGSLTLKPEHKAMLNEATEWGTDTPTAAPSPVSINSGVPR